jgi:hypothetical protein
VIGENVKRGTRAVFLDPPTESSAKQQVKTACRRASN